MRLLIRDDKGCPFNDVYVELGIIRDRIVKHVLAFFIYKKLEIYVYIWICVALGKLWPKTFSPSSLWVKVTEKTSTKFLYILN